MKNSLLVFLFILFAAIRGYGQCTLSVGLSSSSPNICSGSSAVLTASPSAGTVPYSYAWSTGETTQTISVNKPGTYTVTVTDKTAGCPGVKQTITIGTGVTPVAPTVASAAACPNSPVTLTATAPGGIYQWYDAAVGGNFLATGASYTTPPITVPTTFYVETTVNGCTSSRAAVNVTLIGNPLIVGATVCSGTTATLLAGNADSFTWFDAPSGGNVVGNGATFVTPVLLATTVYYVQGTTNGCVSPRIPVTAAVTPPPQAPTVSNITICSGGVATLHATVPTGTIDWFTAPTGGTSLISSPDFTTPPLVATTTYYVQNTVNTCTSNRTPVTVTVSAIPSAPVVPPATTCAGSTATLTPTGPGGTYFWYNVPTGGTQLASGPSFTTPVLNSSTTFYVEVANGSCTSARTAVNITVTQQPASPSASGAIICPGTSATLTATAPGGIYQWYDAPSGGNLLVTNASYTTPALNVNTTYYVQTTVAGCISARTPVAVTILAPPAAPAAPGTTVCTGGIATLSVTSPNGSYAWYDAAAGGNLLGAGSVYVTPALNVTTTYYVESISASGCSSTRTAVTVNVTPLPSAPVINPATVCPGSHATLTATGTTGTVTWYDAPVGGNVLATGTTYVTPALGATTTYYADQTPGLCSSSRTAVIVTVTNVASPQFKYSSGTYCTGAANPAPVINNPSGGTFSAAPAGLVFVSTSTGQIDIAGSVAGTYTVSFAGNGVCPLTTTATIVITATPSAQFSYTSPVCENANALSPAFPAGSSAGTFTAVPAGLVFADPNTGQIVPQSSAAGTYTVTNTIPASGACAAATFSTTVTIDPSVIVSAGPNQTVPSGTPVTLAGSISGGATTGTWSGGTGSFSNPNALNAVYTPGPGETSVTLTLTSAHPAGSCGIKSNTVTITFAAIPPAPTATGATICSGNAVTLTATAPGGSYAWYDAPAGGTQLGTGPNFTTPALIANTTYYVQTTISGATSPRTPVTVTISATPAAPLATGVPICSGSTATLTASGSAGGYEWYDAPIGGNLVSTSNTYTTTFLSANTSFYVQSVVNTCASARTKVDVTINPVPSITSASAGNICSGTQLAYTITSDVPGAAFTWSRSAVAGISNPAVINQAGSSITETLVNTGASPVNVTYIITPAANGCTGASFNYVVTVNPMPAVTSPATASVCSGTPLSYGITFSSPAGVSFTWSRAIVAGISNAAISGQASTNISESLFNTTTAPIDVTYVISYQTSSCSALTFNLVVTVNPTPVITSATNGTACSGTPQTYTITSNVPTATFNWDRPAAPGISNPAVSGQTSNTITESLINTTASTAIVVYIITPIANGCPGKPFNYTVRVAAAVPTPVANSNTPVCTGADIDLQSPIIPNATYTWTGPNGFTQTGQNVTIPNATVANAGTYNLYITINGCSSATVSTNVVVDPLPVADAGPDIPVCPNVASVPISGTVTVGASPGTGQWSTNGTGTFGNPPNVLSNTYLPSAADIAAGSVTLILASTSKDNCSVITDQMTIFFKSPAVTSTKTGAICSGTAQNYSITSDIPTATFTWSRATVAGISNPAVSNQVSSTITETLINTGATPVQVQYLITPIDNGCPGTTVTYTVTVNPIPPAPAATSNSPVCVNTTINLQTPTVAGATYNWTGPNGFTSPQQNPSVPNATAANAGTYNVTITVGGCPSPAGSVNVVVDPLPVATAGQGGTICPSTTSIQLAGSITPAGTTGLWTTSGTGTFTGGGNSTTVLNGQYFPSAQDVTNGSVVLTLASTSNDNCAISTSQMTIKIQLLPAVTAGPNQSICSESNAQLAGQNIIAGGATWTSSGTGTFNPSPNQLNTAYVPSAADIQNGSVVLTLTAAGAGTCYIPSDKLTVKFIPPPTVSAGPTTYVLKGQTVTLHPTVSDPNVTYSWSPNIDISSTSVENPVVTGNVDQTYTLTVTDVRGCSSSSQVKVIVSPTIVIPNAFTPNGDGVNDQWNIQGLTAYQQSSIDIFDRNGQKIFHSIGYGIPWDGTYKGQQVPYGVYYYIIDPKFSGLHVLSGYVTVVR